MTTLVNDNLSTPKRSVIGPRGKNAWRRLWQVPLLVGGVLVFGWGVRALVGTLKPVPFETQVRGIQGLLASGQYDKAVQQINVLGDYYKDTRQQAALQALAGDAHYLAQQAQPVFLRENFEHAADHYRKAVLLGAVPDATMNERWGEAALATGATNLAIEKLEAAIAAQPALLRVHAKDLVNAYQVAGGNHEPERTAALDHAEGVLERLLGITDGGVTVDERAWALCKKVELAIGRGSVGPGGGGVGGAVGGGGGGGDGAAGGRDALQKVVAETRGALATLNERDPTGRVLTWIARAELDEGASDQAEADLIKARSLFAVHHLDDGRATVLLGRIAEAHGARDKAAELFGEVVTAHAGTSIWPAARLGRAEVAAQDGQVDDQVKGDYRYVVQALTDAGGNPAKAPELVSREGVTRSLVSEYQRAMATGRLDDALLFLGLQQEMGDRETPALAHRLATTREARARELDAEADKAAGTPAAAAKEDESRKLYGEAAEDYLRHSKLTTLDDAESSNSLWKAAELFDKAGMVMRSIGVYEQFTVTRPRDPRVPEGLLATGRLYQSAGMIENAIPVYRRNIAENGKTPAAYASAVALARCYMAKGDAATDKPGTTTAKEWYDKAEQSLLSLVQENSDLRPEANEFRISLFTLGELYYRGGRWADAILRLEESIQRYPADPGVPWALFMLGESYRKSALEIADAIAKDPGITQRHALEKAEADRLLQGAGLFTRVIGLLDAEGSEGASGSTPPSRLSALEAEYLRSSYMDRAACYFARGDFAMAIKLYDQTAARFSTEALAVQAYVQIVNAYLALNEPTQASAAAERGRWILKRIPDEALGKGAVPLDRAYYERLLALGKN